MKEMKGFSKKAVAILLMTCLLLGGTIGGTLAWLVTTSGTVTNTFTVGDINITLKEHPFADGSTTELDTSATPVDSIDTYKVVPGGTQPKDPFVTVIGNSEACYLYVTITNNMVIEGSTKIDGELIVANDLNGTDWIAIGTKDETDGGVTTLYRYKAVVNTSTDPQPFTVFNNVNYSDKITKGNIGQLEDKTIVLNAYAHQSANTTQDVADAAAIIWAGVTAITTP